MIGQGVPSAGGVGRCESEIVEEVEEREEGGRCVWRLDLDLDFEDMLGRETKRATIYICMCRRRKQ